MSKIESAARVQEANGRVNEKGWKQWALKARVKKDRIKEALTGQANKFQTKGAFC